MKKATDIFSELGRRLENFGQSAEERAVIERACRDNSWFVPHEVVRAVAAIRDSYLDPNRLTAWIGRYDRPPGLSERRVLVIMAGNIPLVGFFDLLCVVAAGHRCLIKPAAKDTVLMEYVVGLLKEIEPAIPVGFYDGQAAVDAVIATGSDNANRYFRSRYAGMKTLLRGNRHSVAVLCGNETEAQLAALADDMFAYSGLGCRNVSLLFVPEGTEVALPSYAAHSKYRNNYMQRKALRTVCRQEFTDTGTALLIRQLEFPQALSEISVIEYRDPQAVMEWLRTHDAELQCVVANGIEHSRRVDFGAAQRPSLTDYPDEADVIEFLYAL
ncbi:MAG: aldehyde dehydrogenase [Alistipes sp.]|nr:aldehyde dehydrogenase [Alistipes sp.]